MILSINTNLATYDLLIKNKDSINKLFKREIIIYNQKYILIRFVTQPFQNHFISYFSNFNLNFNSSLNIWYKYDDLKGTWQKINNEVIALNNIQESEGLALFIYLKNI